MPRRLSGQADRKAVAGLVFIVLVILVGAFWRRWDEQSHLPLIISRIPSGVMNTHCRLLVVQHRVMNSETVQGALDEGVVALRDTESLLTTWGAESQVARFNAWNETGVPMEMSVQVSEALRLAEEGYRQTLGTFDVTDEPLIRLWRQAAEIDRLPEQAAIEKARAASRWEDLILADGLVIRKTPTVQLNLDGFALAWGMDQAAQAMKDAGIENGSVELGAQRIYFGQPAEGDLWDHPIRDPFGAGRLGKISVSNAAVVTAGRQGRFMRIEGQRYSLTVDPRSGRPAASAPAIIVIASRAVDAWIWASALEVHGPDGLSLLPAGTDALILNGDAETWEILATPGMGDMLDDILDPRLKIFPIPESNDELDRIR